MFYLWLVTHNRFRVSALHNCTAHLVSACCQLTCRPHRPPRSCKRYTCWKTSRCEEVPSGLPIFFKHCEICCLDTVAKLEAWAVFFTDLLSIPERCSTAWLRTLVLQKFPLSFLNSGLLSVWVNERNWNVVFYLFYQLVAFNFGLSFFFVFFFLSFPILKP